MRHVWRVALTLLAATLVAVVLDLARYTARAQETASAPVAADATRLAALARQWPAGAHIKVTLKDGTTFNAVLLDVKATEIVVEPRGGGAPRAIALSDVKSLQRDKGVSAGRVAKYALLGVLALVGVVVTVALAAC